MSSREPQALFFTAPLSPRQFGSANFEIVVVPPDIVAALTTDGSDRVLATYNDDAQGPVQTRLLRLGKGAGHYLLLPQPLRKRLGLRLGDKLRVRLRPDESKYGLPMPDELAELLRQDGLARQHFDALTPGRQRRILHVSGSPKTEATRLRKAVACLAYLRQVGAAGFDYAGLVAFVRETKPQ